MATASTFPSEHQFALVTFTSPKFCSSCNRFIWGLAKQGVQCRTCFTCLHRDCISKLSKEEQICSTNKKDSNQKRSKKRTMQKASTTQAIPLPIIKDNVATFNQPEINIETQSNYNSKKLNDPVISSSSMVFNNSTKNQININSSIKTNTPLIGGFSGSFSIGNNKLVSVTLNNNSTNPAPTPIAHTFQSHTFFKPTWCNFCEKFLYGLSKQGYACTNCSYVAHKDCRSKVLFNCPLKQTNWVKLDSKTKEKQEKQNPVEIKTQTNNETSTQNYLQVQQTQKIQQSPTNSSSEINLQKMNTTSLTNYSIVLNIPTKPKSEPKKTLEVLNDPLNNEQIFQELLPPAKIEDFYIIEKQIGQGGFATVFKVSDKKTGVNYALKRCSRHPIDQDSIDPTVSLQREVSLMLQIDHPNVIKCFKAFSDPQYYYIVLELLPLAEELFDRIEDNRGFSEEHAQKIVKQLLDALDYLHQKGIAHRDLKPENILCTGDDQNLDVRIIDFGFAKSFATDTLGTSLGSPGYCAPEVLDESSYDEKADVWSMGVIIFVMLSGYPPFFADSIGELFSKIQTCDYSFDNPIWDTVSESAKDLIRKMLVLYPKERYSSKQCCEHQWLNEPVKSKNLVKIKSQVKPKKEKKIMIEFKKNFEQFFELGDEITSANITITHSAVYKNDNSSTIVKVVSKKSEDNECFPIDRERLDREVSIMQKMSHPNLASLIDCYEDEMSIFVVLQGFEFPQTLKDFVLVYDNFPESTAILITNSLLSVLEYLHSNGIAHRDLTPQNIIVLGTQNFPDVKLTGFDTSKIFVEGDYSKLILTSGYSAPEFLDDLPYNKSIDLWSLGCVVYYMFAQVDPFLADDQEELFQMIREANYEFDEDYFNIVSQDAKDFISNLMIPSPSKRWALKQCLTSKWIQRLQASCVCLKKFKKLFIKEQNIQNELKELWKKHNEQLGLIEFESATQIFEQLLMKYLFDLKIIEDYKESLSFICQQILNDVVEENQVNFISFNDYLLQ
eukprot:TRINITY_DN506_c3_g1_i3.p1 TRINITY_DN506_c3_g1~~TRINITY_DN506_c3_g1_i3.p1  ORF type:complete len:1007 (-),score=347.87 TRINITY_DN506_c3_g1_i3:27-3047(-)